MVIIVCVWAIRLRRRRFCQQATRQHPDALRQTQSAHGRTSLLHGRGAAGMRGDPTGGGAVGDIRLNTRVCGARIRTKVHTRRGTRTIGKKIGGEKPTPAAAADGV